MDLQVALLILGAVLILIIFGISRYSDAIDQYQQKRQASKALKANSIDVQPERRAKNAPKFNDSADELDEGRDDLESPLFKEFTKPEFEAKNEEDEKTEHGQNHLLHDQDKDSIKPQHKSADYTSDVKDGSAEVIESLKEETASIGPFTSLRQIDFWIKLSPASPYTQAQVIDKLGDRDKVNFPVQIHGLTQEQSNWVNILDVSKDTKLVDIVASYQLIHQGNVALITDIQAFDEQVTSLGKAIAAEKLMMATPRQAFEQSQKLAQFYQLYCEPIQASVNAPDGQAFMGKLVETSAKQQGLEYVDGEYVRIKRMGSENIILYRMVSGEQKDFDEDMSSDSMITIVYFTMIPALSLTPGRDAKEMLDAIKAFASRVKGQIRIADNDDFDQDQLLNLRNLVSNLEQEMIDSGLEPGGLEIKRLFL